MIRRLLKAIGFGGVAMASSCSQPVGRPYEDRATQLIYELLFCDRLELFRDNHQGALTPPWSVIYNADPDFVAVAKIAGDDTQESRIRMLAFNILRTAQRAVPEKELLGTIIEVHLPDGLDTLAVFSDGSARYINHSGKLIIVEGAPSIFENEIQQVITSSKPIVSAIGPWNKDRLPAPNKGNIRMTFLVSDGLYFGEGPINMMSSEEMAKPLIDAATLLLVKLVEKTENSEHAPPAGRGEAPRP